MSSTVAKQPGHSGSSTPRIAYFSPLPPAKSGIADYTRELIRHFAGKIELVLFTEHPAEADSTLRRSFEVRAISEYPQRRCEFDCAFYHIGNNLLHREIYQMAVRFPGITVLHDYGLHHFISKITAGSGSYFDYVRELSYADGLAGAEFAWQIRLGHRSPPIFELPLNDRLLDRSQEIIVHSQYVANAIRSRSLNRRVRIIPHLVQKRIGRSKRMALSISEDTFVFCVAGFLTSDKHIDMTLKAISMLSDSEREVVLLLVGQPAPGLELEKLIADYDLGPSVHQVGYATSFGSYLDWIASSDVVINLRHPTVGETSGSVLRSLSQGRPVIVFDEGWYSELPDDVCWKVRPLDFEHLLHVTDETVSKPEIGMQKGQNAVKYIEDTCDPDMVSELYIETIVSYIDRLNTKYLAPSG